MVREQCGSSINRCVQTHETLPPRHSRDGRKHTFTEPTPGGRVDIVVPMSTITVGRENTTDIDPYYDFMGPVARWEAVTDFALDRALAPTRLRLRIAMRPS